MVRILHCESEGLRPALRRRIHDHRQGVEDTAIEERARLAGVLLVQLDVTSKHLLRELQR